MLFIKFSLFFFLKDYLQYEGGKFSKSKGVGVFGNSAKETGISPSIWRFFLLSRRPESGDTEFTWNEFISANNNQLLKNFGNFVNRVSFIIIVKVYYLIKLLGSQIHNS